MRRNVWIMGALACLLPAAFAPHLYGQSEKLSIALRDPNRPATVRVGLLSGSLTVKAHAGKDVVVEAEAKASDKEREASVPESARGLRRLNTSGSSITLEEENNVVTIFVGMRRRGEDLLVLVPLKSSLKLSLTNGKMLTVEGVEGEMELSATNGSITLNDVAGSVVAHAMNGKIVAKLKRVDEGKPMSFSAYNSHIDVTLPAATKANLKMQTQNGEVFSDFDVQLQPNAITREDKDSAREGKRRVRYESISTGTINGGGPEYSFKNFNGNIYIRKAQ